MSERQRTYNAVEEPVNGNREFWCRSLAIVSNLVRAENTISESKECIGKTLLEIARQMPYRKVY